ncbi:MAG: T9SS type A sorting domain-containing protein, partial [Saprospiraceae bacterium]
DNYPEETTWAITNAGGSVVASGGPYGSQADGSTLNTTVCLPDGCYNFTISDSYGDGICCSYGNGSYTVSQGGTTLASGGSFTTSQTTNICIGGGPAPTCDDGIQNGDETGVDCGGSCAPCATCDDGIQNGDETGVDCGGSCAPCGGGGCTTTQVNFANFESNFGIWIDGGTDCARVTNATYANSGTRSVRLRDNTSTSVMTTGNLNLAGYEEVTVDFSYYPVGMESGEDFWLQVSTNGGSSYQTLVTWASGADFNNNTRYNESVTITGTFTSNTRIRFRNDASADNDAVYFDDINISGCVNGNRLSGEEFIADVLVANPAVGVNHAVLFPNPTSEMLNVDFFFSGKTEGNVQMIVTDITGKQVLFEQYQSTPGAQRRTVDVSRLSAGVYMLHIVTDEGRTTHKFAVTK